MGRYETELDEGIDTSNMCFMAQGDSAHKVQYEPILDNVEITFEEILWHVKK